MAIYRGPGGAGDSTDDAIVSAVAELAADAAQSATEAAASASTASTAASTSGTNSTNAATSASQAATSATNANTSAGNASSSATNAASSATSATASATSASNSAASASTSASNASSSASTAASNATAAATSASQAATSATNATTTYNNTVAIYGNTTAVQNAVNSASTSATNAANSASAAATSATNAANSASSANTYAAAALNSANNANAKASESQTSANNAAASAAEAANYANAAEDLYGSAAALENAVDAAQASATASANSATASANSATQATINGAVQVALATTQATNAANSATAAATSATNAANSATQAAASAASAAAIVTGVASNRPSIRPSLLLDFANTKQLDPRITFSRPTTATYYDGKTVVKAEENLLSYSQEFDNAYWSPSRTTVTANATTAPDGTSTAEQIINTATTGFHGWYSTYARIPSGTHTLSLFIKKGTQRYVTFDAADDPSNYASIGIDLDTGTITRSASTGGKFTYVSSSISSAGNGWYRVSLTATLTASTYFEFQQRDTEWTSGSNVESYTGNTGQYTYIWGAQLEQRSTVTAYTPTTTAPITNYIPALQTAVSNDARFDHDPVTGESKGLLIEEQRTNLLTYSDQFDNAVWAKTNITVTADTTIAPNGLLSGDKLVESSTTGTHRIAQTLTATGTSTALTFSFYAKAAERTWICVGMFDSTPTLKQAFFDVQNVQLGTVGTNLTASIQSVGNGWVRCSATVNPSTTGSSSFTIYLAQANNATSYTGDGSSGIYIWGAQLEAGSFATSYIQTVASQVTRSADSASMTGSNFSSWYRADEGTLYTNFTYDVITVFAAAPAFFNSVNTGINSIGFYNNSTSALIGTLRANSGTAVTISKATTVVGTHNIALAYKVNDMAFTLDGAAVGTATPNQLPTIDMLGIAGAWSGLFQVGNAVSHIKRIAYYPKRLSNTELQGLTS